MNQRQGFEHMVRAYSAELFRYAHWACRDRALAEDLVQETFARAWESWSSLRDEKAARGWLYTILRNERARLFERKKLNMIDELELDEIAEPQSITPDDRIDLSTALAKLHAGYREPLLLQLLGGFSCAEIAVLLSTSEGAIMTRLTRARLALRKLDPLATRRKSR